MIRRHAMGNDMPLPFISRREHDRLLGLAQSRIIELEAALKASNSMRVIAEATAKDATGALRDRVKVLQDKIDAAREALDG